MHKNTHWELISRPRLVRQEYVIAYLFEERERKLVSYSEVEFQSTSLKATDAERVNLLGLQMPLPWSYHGVAGYDEWPATEEAKWLTYDSN